MTPLSLLAGRTVWDYFCGIRLVIGCTMDTEIGQTLEKLPFGTIYETSEDLLLRIRYTYTAEYQRKPFDPYYPCFPFVGIGKYWRPRSDTTECGV